MRESEVSASNAESGNTGTLGRNRFSDRIPRNIVKNVTKIAFTHTIYTTRTTVVIKQVIQLLIHYSFTHPPQIKQV